MAKFMVKTRIFANQIRAVYHCLRQSSSALQCPLVAIWMMIICICLQILLLANGEEFCNTQVIFALNYLQAFYY